MPLVAGALPHRQQDEIAEENLIRLVQGGELAHCRSVFIVQMRGPCSRFATGRRRFTTRSYAPISAPSFSFTSTLIASAARRIALAR
jgi:hypothetical protein